MLIVNRSEQDSQHLKQLNANPIKDQTTFSNRANHLGACVLSASLHLEHLFAFDLGVSRYFLSRLTVAWNTECSSLKSNSTYGSTCYDDGPRGRS